MLYYQFQISQYRLFMDIANFELLLCVSLSDSIIVLSRLYVRECSEPTCNESRLLLPNMFMKMHMIAIQVWA